MPIDFNKKADIIDIETVADLNGLERQTAV
jgi:hypothetical protein